MTDGHFWNCHLFSFQLEVFIFFLNKRVVLSPCFAAVMYSEAVIHERSAFLCSSVLRNSCNHQNAKEIITFPAGGKFWVSKNSAEIFKILLQFVQRCENYSTTCEQVIAQIVRQIVRRIVRQIVENCKLATIILRNVTIILNWHRSKYQQSAFYIFFGLSLLQRPTSGEFLAHVG